MFAAIQPEGSDPHHDQTLETTRKNLRIYPPMEIHTAHAEPIGEFIHDGRHKPFRALACQVGLSSRPTISREPIHAVDWLELYRQK